MRWRLLASRIANHSSSPWVDVEISLVGAPPVVCWSEDRSLQGALVLFRGGDLQFQVGTYRHTYLYVQYTPCPCNNAQLICLFS